MLGGTLMNLNDLKIGDKVKTKDVYSEKFVEMLGEELTVVGTAVSFLSSTELMAEVKQWAQDFNPDDYED
jgi:lysyl-tRNA synthetase class I